MSEARPDEEPATAIESGEVSEGARDAAEGPLVDPELVPEVEVPAVRPRAPLWKSVSVALIAILVLAGLGIGASYAVTLWGTRAMLETGIKGAEALITGDSGSLAAVSTADVRAGLTDKVRADMKSGGALATFSAPEWSGDSAFISAMVGPNPGRLAVFPDGRDPNAVDFETTGSLGKAKGVIRMTRDVTGWKIAGLTVVPQN